MVQPPTSQSTSNRVVARRFLVGRRQEDAQNLQDLLDWSRRRMSRLKLKVSGWRGFEDGEKMIDD